MRLQEFLLTSGAPHVSWAQVTLGARGPRNWPQMPKDSGLIVVGRPSLFGNGLTTLLDTADPPMGYEFFSNEPTRRRDYRTIRRMWDASVHKEERLIRCPLFSDLRKRRNPRLTDNALIYIGWQGGRPLMMLAGTSAVGSWGAAQYVTEAPRHSADFRNHETMQGVIAASVRNSPLAFEQIDTTEPIELTAPFEVTFRGTSLPWLSDWRNLSLQTSGREPLDVELEVNGHVLARRARSHLPLLTLLAWFDSTRARPSPVGYVCEWNRTDLVAAIFRLLWDEVGGAARAALERVDVRSAAAFKKGYKTAIYADLELLTVQIRRAGGIAFEEATRPVDQMAGSRRYTAYLRSLPAFDRKQANHIR